MKKLVLISTLIASFAGISAFGQGYFIFATGKSQVWDDFSTSASHLSSSVNVSFLWAANGSVPLVSSILASTPTSGSTPYSYSQAWTDILTDPNFTLCVNSGTGNSLVSVGTTVAGAISYNTGGAFAGPLSTAPNTVYTLFMIGWNNAYATPALASAAGAAVGWSAAFQYTPAAFTSTPSNMTGLAPQFGVGVIPEPTTMALAGLGSLMLLAIRRRK